MKTVLIPIAPGFEEIEALTVIDILRRGGVNVIAAGIMGGPVEGRSGIRVIPDTTLEEVNPDDLDMIVLPGGQPGTDHLKEDLKVRAIIKALHEKDKYTAAICAAPTVLSSSGLLDGKNVTSHPSVEKDLAMTNYSEERVVVDGRIVTSRSPGTAMEFAMKLLEILCGKEVMDKVNDGILARLG